MQCSSSLGRETQAEIETEKEREICSRREDEANQRHVVFIFTTHGARGQIPAETHSSSLQITHTCTHTPKQGQKAEKMGTMPPSHASPHCERTRTNPISSRSSASVFPEIKCSHTHTDIHTHTDFTLQLHYICSDPPSVYNCAESLCQSFIHCI